MEIHVQLGDLVEAGTPVMTVHAEAPGELVYALGYVNQNRDLLPINDASDEHEHRSQEHL